LEAELPEKQRYIAGIEEFSKNQEAENAEKEFGAGQRRRRFKEAHERLSESQDKLIAALKRGKETTEVELLDAQRALASYR
jgi:hypothetical protein